MQDNSQQSVDNNGTDQLANSLKPPVISLPKGGGAIRGIGEKFAANPVTGTGSLTVPIATSPGRSGFGPQLTLSYDSGAGNSSFGLGWNLALPAISRKTDKGLPRYHDLAESDEFILSGAEDLVPFLVEKDGNWARQILPPRTVHGTEYKIQRYRPRIEGLFARIERWTNIRDPSESFWRSISRDNITTWYGKTAESRIADPADPIHIFSWLICESHDDKGNIIVYEYKAEDSTNVNQFSAHERNRTEQTRRVNRYLKRIKYGNALPYQPRLTESGAPTSLPDRWFFEVVLDYGEHNRSAPLPNDVGTWLARPDPFSTYRPGFEVRSYRLCHRVLMFHHFTGTDLADEMDAGENYLVRATEFEYSQLKQSGELSDPIHTILTSVTQRSYRRKSDGAYTNRALPPVEFEYSKARLGTEIKDIDAASLENLPYGVDGHHYQWVDVDGEGLSGILTEQGGSWFYKHNQSPITRTVGTDSTHYSARLSPARIVESIPAGGLANRQFLDLAGDGQLDLVHMAAPVHGFYERTADLGWESFRAFEQSPNIDWQDPNLKFIDLTGDGHADALITEQDAFTWYPSLAETGFDAAQRTSVPSDEERGPRVLFADGTETIFQADLSGDGLTDIVRIRNGEVCYWPNLGYGRFGAKVTMDDSPWFDSPDQFEPSRIRLADIDGSGVTDIIYLGRNITRVWFNESGNGWSSPQTLEGFIPVDNIASVTAVDLLGNGTACLVWSTAAPASQQAPMKYLSLMTAGKPHLMIRTRNNLGAETHIQYAPSTYFYLKDKQAGKPWITRLPFPVHVVEKVIVTDKWRETRFATTYSYHHGYFDGAEREFRGFGRVEQIDIESYGEFAAANGDSSFIVDDQTLYQPPVKTITWFHTGAMLNRSHVLDQYQQEYFPAWAQSKLAPTSSFAEDDLPEPDLDTLNLTSEEWREAMRACKGMPLRQEIYELDATALATDEHRPVKLFSAAYHNCHIKRLQPQSSNPHAVFLVTESEVITYHYELDLTPAELLPDPRIAHTLNLNIDDYGNVLQAATVVYPRIKRHQDSSLSANTEDRIAEVQTERHITYTETHFTNDAIDTDHHRLRMPCEVLTYELTGISPEDDADRATDDPRDNFYFTLDELRRFRLSEHYQVGGETVASIPYHQVPNRSTAEKRLVQQVRMLFFAENLQNPLPFRSLNSLALPFETYTLALTDDLLAAILGAKMTADIERGLANSRWSGYLSGAELADRFDGADTRGQYWIRSGIAGFSADAAAHFYLPERYTDPFAETTTLNYDPRDLYIRSSTDPLGNTVSIEHFNYRVLAPVEMRGINNNLSEVAFDTLGLPSAMASKGDGSNADHLSGITDDWLDLDVNTRARFFTQDYDEAEARRLLASSTARHVYDFGENIEADGSLSYGHRPASAATILREQHVTQLRDGAVSPLQVAFEYSDGGGNVLVNKVQAEPETPGGPLRWIANGKTILNNKGKPVKQYEPYFSEDAAGNPDHHFEEPRAVGVTPIMYYDAPGRLIRTELPDGSFSRAEITPWHVTTYDANDTVLESGNTWYTERTGADATVENRRAARLAAEHNDTPTTVFLDSLGREVISVAHNKVRDGAGHWVNEKYLTFTKLDSEGKPLWIRDARGNLVMQYITPIKPIRLAEEPDPSQHESIPINSVPCYDIAGNLLFQHSMDAGERWMLSDATGQPFYGWDENERVIADGSTVLERRVFHTSYDELRRPLEQRLKINSHDWQIIERFVYGESHAEAINRNLRGQVYQHYDPSGLVTNQRFDFKGNLLEVTRQLASDYQSPVIDWPTNPPLGMFIPETFTQITKYDALNRMTQLFNWHRDVNRVAVYEPQYNERGVLKSENLFVSAQRVTGVDGAASRVGGQEITAIREITYNAKGQRLSISYGNHALTSYEYDESTFRLIKLVTTRPASPTKLQDLHYTYDPVGNITQIVDKAQQTAYFRNAVIEPSCLYEYDALYRLVRAEGREHAAQNNIQRDNTTLQPDIGIPFPNSPNALQRYVEQYRYDAVGNILSMAHSGGTDLRWKRCYQYAQDSNRLLATAGAGEFADATAGAACPPHYVTTPTLSQRYEYDTHGSMLNLVRNSDNYRLRWDYRDMIHQVNLGGGGIAWYNYDAEKQRTRKRLKRLGGIIEERLYLDGMEFYRRYNTSGALLEEIESHHLFADDQRVLILEDVLQTDNATLGVQTLLRYQLGNHLGSISVELDEAANVISYEEYHPYGTTAYQLGRSDIEVKLKRYCYTGMERDEETGLSYHTARYYLPWLGRWGSVDPAGLKGGINHYLYASLNSLRYVDLRGTNDEEVSLGESLWRGVKRLWRRTALLREIVRGAGLATGGPETPDNTPEITQDNEDMERDRRTRSTRSASEDRRRQNTVGSRDPGTPPEPHDHQESPEQHRERLDRRAQGQRENRRHMRERELESIRREQRRQPRRFRARGSVRAVAAQAVAENVAEQTDVAPEDTEALGAISSGGQGVLFFTASHTIEFLEAGAGLDLEARAQSEVFSMSSEHRAELAQERQQQRRLEFDEAELERHEANGSIFDSLAAREVVNEERRQRTEEVEELLQSGASAVASSPTTEISLIDWVKIQWNRLF